MAKRNKSNPLTPRVLNELKENLSIRGKSTLKDWEYLIVGIGCGLFSNDWESTITIEQLYEILTHGITDQENDAFFSDPSV